MGFEEMETAGIGQPEGAWSLEKLDFETSPFYPYGKESCQPMLDATLWQWLKPCPDGDL